MLNAGAVAENWRLSTRSVKLAWSHLASLLYYACCQHACRNAVHRAGCQQQLIVVFFC